MIETIRFNACPLLQPQDLSAVVNFLKAGQVVAIPTETVYGLAADVMQEDAVRRIYMVKGRPIDNPLIAHISSMEQLTFLTKDPQEEILHLARHFWPGPLTLLFQRRPEIPAIVSAGLPQIAVRMPSHPCARQIIEAVGSPLAAPSANRSGFPSPTRADDVLEDLNGLIPAVVDGGECSFGIESTVVGFSEGRPVLFRPGAISRREIEKVLGMPLVDSAPTSQPMAPGMKYRHYAPHARVFLTQNMVEWKEKLSPKVYAPTDITAKNLFFHLRKADRLGYAEIVILLDERIMADEALMNRLSYAAKE